MTPKKEKVLLTKEQETLLITLYSRAVESRNTSLFQSDAKAQQILDRLDYDFKNLKVPRKTAVSVCLRSSQFDRYARNFLSRHPGALILHLGCGLDTRFDRVDNGKAQWYDLDLPDVIRLRRRFFEETGRYHMLDSSAADLGWINRIAVRSRPALILAEGLMMYLQESEVRTLVLSLQKNFPGCELAFDAFSRMTARSVHNHPSLRQTAAGIHWGVDDPREIEAWGEGIRLRETWFFSQAEEVTRLSYFYRFAYWLAGKIPAARNAHRILYFQL